MPRLPNAQFHLMVPTIREEGFYEYEEPRAISWSEYNISQVEEARDVLDFISESVDSCEYLSVRGKIGRPLTDAKVLAKAVLLSEALGFRERNSEGWIDILGPRIGIFEHLDDKTIGDAYDKIEVLHILKQVFDKSKTSDGRLSGDGTGLETSRKQNYQDGRGHGDYMTSVVDSREVVQAFDAEEREELAAMRKLVEQVHGDSLRLDAGFIDRELVRKIEELGMIPYVFPTKSLILNGGSAWKNMFLELFLDVMHWLTEYHQRSHCESFHSSFKRTFGIILKRRPMTRLVQITARIILHNRKRLSYFNKLAKAS